MSLTLLQLLARMNPHLSDEAISLLISGELSGGRIRWARRHLAMCWKCRARQEQLEMAAMKFVELDKRICQSIPPDNPTARRNLIRRMNELAAVLPAPSYRPWLRMRLHLRFPEISTPRLAAVLTTVCLFAVLLTLWQRKIQTVTASEFMLSAVAADSTLSNSEVGGVVYQRVRFRSAKGTIDAALYRDVSGRRRQRKPVVNDQQEQLYAKLENAGIAWQNPLSSANFKNWHDRQRGVVDSVKRSGDGLLTLTTKVQDSIVSDESFTVREGTFHPVARVVDFKDFGPVEISELNYEILSWDAINKDLFEPLDDISNSIHASGQVIVPFIAPLHLLSAEQLDEAELVTRLELTKLHLDGNGRIILARNPQGIEVRGIVVDEESKRELVARLRLLAHVVPSIYTEQEAASSLKLHSEITAVSAASVIAEPAPLENYLAKRHWPVEDRSRLSVHIFQDALAADQEALALSNLADRFSPAKPLTNTAAAARKELIARHRKSLLINLRDEQIILAEAENNWQVPLPVAQNSSSSASLTEAAKKNLSLCKELTLGTGEADRPADAIASELVQVVLELRLAAERIPIEPVNFAITDRKQ